jgi:hypothetical protein
MKRRTIIVTVWGDPNEVTVGSSYGQRMTHREWCERLLKELPQASIETGENGFIRVIRRRK